MSLDYDYERYEELIVEQLEAMWRDEDELEIGEDISSIEQVKIIFDGHGDLEDEDENGEYRYTERGDKNMESYAIFIHKDALKEGFTFPEHELTPWALIHRPKEEICIYAWYDVANDSWDILPLEDRIESDCVMTEEDVMAILEGLHEAYFKPSETNLNADAAWPFK
jgi:hypothetical protein